MEETYCLNDANCYFLSRYVMFFVCICLFVCLFVPQITSKIINLLLDVFPGRKTNQLNFGDTQDQRRFAVSD